MKHRMIAGAIAVAVMALATGTAGEPLKSGIQVDGRTSAFNTLNLTGPDKDKSLCLV